MRVMRRSKRRKKNPMRRESKGFGFYIVKTETTAAVVRGEWGRPLYILVIFGVLSSREGHVISLISHPYTRNIDKKNIKK